MPISSTQPISPQARQPVMSASSAVPSRRRSPSPSSSLLFCACFLPLLLFTNLALASIWDCGWGTSGSGTKRALCPMLHSEAPVPSVFAPSLLHPFHHPSLHRPASPCGFRAPSVRVSPLSCLGSSLSLCLLNIKSPKRLNPCLKSSPLSWHQNGAWQGTLDSLAF